MRVYDERDGLPQISVIALAFDQRGYLWAGTDDGAARYNGRTWTVLPLPKQVSSPMIRTILPTDDGIWFASFGGGVARLHDGEWTCYDTSSGLPHDVVITARASVDVDGRPAILAGTRGGLARIRDGVCTSLGSRSHSVWSVLERRDAAGEPTIWTAHTSGVSRLAGGRWTTWSIEDAIPLPGVWGLVELQASDGSGERRLFATGSGGLCVFDGERWLPWTEGAPLSSSLVGPVVETPYPGAGRALWVGTQGNGLWRRVNGAWSHFHIGNGFPHNDVWTLLYRREPDGGDALWAGTGGGLVRIRLDGWTSFDTSTGLPDLAVTSFAESTARDGGRTVWIGTEAGLACHSNGAWSEDAQTAHLPSERVEALLPAEDESGEPVLWVGTRNGAARRDRDGWATYGTQDGLASTYLVGLLEAPDGFGGRAVYAATNAGLAVFDGASWSRHPVVAALPDASCLCALYDEDAANGDTLWVGMGGSGLARVRGRDARVFGLEDGLPSRFVVALHLTTDASGRRVLWAATFLGAVRFDLDEPARPPLLLDEESSPALLNRNVYQVREDRRGRLYMTTNRGVARLTPRTPTAADPAEYTVETFTAENGLPHNECNSGASMVDGYGRIWVGTIGGAAVFDPELETALGEAAPLFVEAAYTDDGRAIEEGAELRHSENAAVFEYALLSYFRESDTRYSTQLVGFDRDASAWTTEFRRSYTNLPAGRYRFVVRGRDYAGTEANARSVAFEIRPAPWRTWWAYVGYAAVGAGAMAAGYRARTAALRRRGEELEQTVAERTAALSESEATTRAQAETLADMVEQLRQSEARALASERDALEANRAKSTFLSNMSHELRTPLNAVLGFAQLMERDRERRPGDVEALDAIQRSGEHLLSLINDVLSISKIEAGQLSLAESQFDPRRLVYSVEEMLRFHAEAKGIGLAFDVEDGVPATVRGDEAKLRQVLVNLLGNAIKFTDAGGVVLRAAWRDGRGLFEVEDTGYGIAADEIATLFEPFTQTESGRSTNEGTGLGLAISRTIVRLMGGDIRVTSELDRGTRFAFDVALARSEERAPDEERRKVSRLAPEQIVHRLLVVDDREENRLLLVRLLEAVGFQARSAENGAEAIAAWEDWQPDLIWMDMRMPVMDGLEATRLLREREREMGVSGATRIVALTASAFEQDREAILAAGCDDYVAKPYRDQTIFRKLQEHLGVAFEYEGEPGREPTEDGDGSDDLSTGQFAALPGDLSAGLRTALERGDLHDAALVADAIAEHDAALARAVKAMIRQYRTDEILEYLDR